MAFVTAYKGPFASKAGKPEGRELSTTAEDAVAALAQDEAPADARASLIGAVDSAFRLSLPGAASERAFRISLLAVTLFYLLSGVAIVVADYYDLTTVEEAQRQREQRGQIEGPPSMEVAIVDAPSLDAQEKHARDGMDAPPQQASEQPPQMHPTIPPEPMEQQQPQPAEQAPPAEAKETPNETEADKTAEAEAEKQPEKVEAPPDKPLDKPKPQQQPVLKTEPTPLGVDLSMRAYAEAVDAAIERRKRAREAQQHPQQKDASRPATTAMLAGSSRVRGAAKSGRTDPYSQSVIAALLRAKPPPFALRGSVMVSFEIGPGGSLKYVKMLNSSGNTAMDQEAINAIRRARFDPPPPHLTPDDLTYIIHYIFE